MFPKLQAKLVTKGGFSLKVFTPGGENLTPHPARARLTTVGCLPHPARARLTTVGCLPKVSARLTVKNRVFQILNQSKFCLLSLLWLKSKLLFYYKQVIKKVFQV